MQDPPLLPGRANPDSSGHLGSSHCVLQVVKGKPAPECFLRAAQGMGVAPTACLVIEDSPSGVEAAIAAGMRVVAVPSVVSHCAAWLVGQSLIQAACY